MNQIPQTLNDVIKYLEEKYPERTPREFQSEFELGFNAGIMYVIDNLKREVDYINIQEKIK